MPAVAPRINVKRVLSLRDEIATDWQLLQLLDAELGTVELKFLWHGICEKLPKKITPAAVMDSLRPYAGQPLTEKLLKQLAWRIAGNVHRLSAGKYAGPWTRQDEDEWMPLQIVDSAVGRSSTGAPGATFRFKVLAGSACTELVSRFWSRKFCRFLADRFGFSKPWGKYPFRDTVQLVGMRLLGEFKQELCLGQPVFDKIMVSGPLKSHNQHLAKSRARVGFECPEGYKHECRHCPIGYDQCPVGTHPYTYHVQHCDQCLQESYFDKRNNICCIACQERHNMSAHASN